MLDKERCIKEQIYISKYFMLHVVALKSPVKFFFKCFLGVKFRKKFEVVQQKQFLSVVANHSKLYRKLSGI